MAPKPKARRAPRKRGNPFSKAAAAKGGKKSPPPSRAAAAKGGKKSKRRK